MSEPTSIHMGHGQMVDIVTRGTGQWELVFSEAGKPRYPAPPLAEVEADAIDTDGNIHPLTISVSENISSVLASGQIDGAYRVRLRVVHGSHFHTRESFLPGATPLSPRIGPHGGALATIGPTTSIEIKTLDATRWELFILDQRGVTTPPPPAEQVVVQAVGPRAEDYQIRNLTTALSDSGSTLIASGKIKDATHARITIHAGGRQEIRGVPIVGV